MPPSIFELLVLPPPLPTVQAKMTHNSRRLVFGDENGGLVEFFVNSSGSVPVVTVMTTHGPKLQLTDDQRRDLIDALHGE